MRDPIRVELHLNIKFWDAVKIRIAGPQAEHFLKDIKRQIKNLCDAAMVDTVSRIEERERRTREDY